MLTFVLAVYFSLQLGAAADIASTWSLSSPKADILLRSVVFFILLPVLFYWINTRTIKVFGWFETVGGFAKLVIVVALSLILYYLAGVNEGIQGFNMVGNDHLVPPEGSHTYLSNGFASSDDFPTSWANFFTVLPIVAFSWTGVEIVAVTAFEAKDLLSLRLPSQRIPYVVFLVYFVCAIGSGMAVEHDNPALAQIYRGQDTKASNSPLSPVEGGSPVGTSSSLIVIAANQVGKYKMAQAFNGILIFSALSAGNTSLYVASRTLFGLVTNHRNPNKIFQFFAEVDDKGAPWRAVAASAIMFFWLPFLSLKDIPWQNDSYTQGPRPVNAASQQFVSTVSSLCVLFVWGTICLAFVRYHRWLARNREFLKKEFSDIDRWGELSSSSTVLKKWQPWVAYFGLVTCVLMVLVFPLFLLIRAPVASRSTIAFEVLQVYLTPIFITILWLGLKARRYRQLVLNEKMLWWVKLGNQDSLRSAINELTHQAPSRRNTDNSDRRPRASIELSSQAS